MKIKIWRITGGMGTVFIVTGTSHDPKEKAAIKYIHKAYGIKKPKETKYRESKEWDEWFHYYNNLSIYEVPLLDARK